MQSTPPNSDRKALQQAIVSAFPSWESLEQFLDYDVGGRKLGTIVARGGLADVVYALLKAAIAEGWFGELEVAVLRERAANAAVADYAKTQRKAIERAAPATEAIGPELERIVRADLDFQDVRAWTLGLLRAQRTVCRVDVDGRERGTGFLVARDLVLTNHHVVGAVIAGGDGARVTLHFDFHTEPLDRGRAVSLAADWLVASSAPSPLDTKRLDDRGGAEPDTSTLDYALLRLARPAGDDEVGGALRGFLQSEVLPAAYGADAPIVILQHPQGRQQQVAIDTKGIISVNAGRTRVRYRTNTEPGSSGSPCFDLAWRLVGLHHSGEPGYQHAGCNEGIPIDTIFTNLPAIAQSVLAESRRKVAPVPPAPVPEAAVPAAMGAPTNRELREVLSGIFTSPARIRMLLGDAGVTTSRISFEQAPVVIWDSALAEARDAQLLARVVATARDEYPRNAALVELARRLGL